MENKKVLFISPSFFEYEKHIKNKLIENGFSVDLYDDRVSNSSLIKILIRLNPKLLSFITHKYYKNIIKKSSKNYNYVFFIKCESPLEKDLQELKKAFPNAKFILYLYDSIKNIKYYSMKKEYFDEIFTFDMEDAQENKEMKFRPLFYIDSFFSKKKEDIKYEYSFIGSCHSDRPKIINQIRKQINNESCFFRLYVSSRINFVLRMLIDNDFRELYKNKIITLNKFSNEFISNIYNESNVIIDIENPNQSGLTMRTVEVLGLKKKMITTNKEIIKYNFFNKSNIELIERDEPIISNNFKNSKFVEIDDFNYEYYSLNYWITEIFNKEIK